MKLNTNQINKLKGETFLNCWSGGGLFKKMCINKLKEDYLTTSLKMICLKLKQQQRKDQ